MKREPLPLQVVIALLVAAATVAQAGQSQSLIPAVRQAIAQQDFARGEKLIDAYRAGEGVTPVMLEALSWLGRGALAAKQWDNAEEYVQETYDLSLTALKGRSMDQDSEGRVGPPRCLGRSFLSRRSVASSWRRRCSIWPHPDQVVRHAHHQRHRQHESE